jgi:hypothetical protein
MPEKSTMPSGVRGVAAGGAERFGVLGASPCANARTGATIEAVTTITRTTEWRISTFTITPPGYMAGFGVVDRSYGRSGVAEHVERFRRQIRKHQVPEKHAFALKAAFLEDATRRLMVDVAQGIHARDLELSR